MKARAAVILIQDDKIALLERHRSGRHYFVFPGGKINPEESPQVAAAREAWEELGLEVKTKRMVAEVWYLGRPQYYFLADLIGGNFGHGTGSEMSNLPESDKGSYLPTWIPVDELPHQPVLPRLVADFVLKSHHTHWPEKPLVITDNPPDQIE